MTIMFCITRNLYQYAPGIIHNLIKTNPTIKRIYLFIEDYDFPYPLDRRVKTINVNAPSFPKYIKEDSPNSDNRWTYMSFIRCFVSRILQEDKIIYLDLDLVFYGNLELLWNIDFEGNYLCAVQETQADHRSYIPGFPMPGKYINSGVLLLNLKAIRKDGIDLKLCDFLNTYKLQYPDQDAINMVCRGHIKYISPSFNNQYITKGDPKDVPLVIVHASQIKPWEKRSDYYRVWKENNDIALGISN